MSVLGHGLRHEEAQVAEVLRIIVAEDVEDQDVPGRPPSPPPAAQAVAAAAAAPYQAATTTSLLLPEDQPGAEYQEGSEYEGQENTWGAPAQGIQQTAVVVTVVAVLEVVALYSS